MKYDEYIKKGSPGKLKLFKRWKQGQRAENSLHKIGYLASDTYVVVETKRKMIIYKIVRTK